MRNIWYKLMMFLIRGYKAMVLNKYCDQGYCLCRFCTNTECQHRDAMEAIQEVEELDK